MSVLEKEIEGRVCEAARELNFLEEKVRFVRNGYPDRIFISPHGFSLWIELKKEGEVPEVIQNYRILELRKRSQIAFWTDQYDECLFAFQTLVEPAFISKAGDPASALARFGRAVLRSRFGQDFRRISYLQDLEEKRSVFKDAYRRPFETSLQGLAGRNREVGRL
jgi:hypothetical protein